MMVTHCIFAFRLQPYTPSLTETEAMQATKAMKAMKAAKAKKGTSSVAKRGQVKAIAVCLIPRDSEACISNAINAWNVYSAKTRLI